MATKMEIKVQIGELIETIAEYKNQQLQYNQEIDIDDLDIKIPTPTGLAPINHVIKKNTSGIKITFDNGHVLRCANKHILNLNNEDIYADVLTNGDVIDSLNGGLKVENIEDDGTNDYYDISVPSPHLYYDAHGIVHHNTLITATLSHLIEPYGRSIIIVPNKSLVEQTEADYKNIGLDVGVYYGDRKEYNKTHTICTWQSLAILNKKSKKEDENFIDEFLEDVIAVIADECFDADSLVLTSNGYIKIKDIKIGDIVINYNEKKKTFKNDVVVDIYQNISKSINEKMYELEFDNGRIIKVTANHKFLTNNGWKRADEIDEDDEIISISDKSCGEVL
jgi:intein/homing endonuclease